MRKPKTQKTVRPAVPKGFGALRAEADESRFDLPESEEPEDDAAQRQNVRHRQPHANATAIVVAATFEAAVPKKLRRRLAHGRTLAVTVVVPTADWVAPVAAYAKSAFGDQWCFQTRLGSDRKQNASVGNDEVARDLSRGRCVMGIAADAKLLPSALAAAADIAIRLDPPSPAALRKAIARFTRRSPGELAAGTAAGLDLHAVVAAFRPGTGAPAIVRRLEASAAAGRDAAERLPDLATAIEFGAARIWGLNLARDISDFSKNLIPWSALDRGICLHSPAGYGKSWYPKVLSKACGGIPLVSTSVGSWFAESPGFLDSVVKKQREAYQSAASAAAASPLRVALLHIDEIDAIPNRASLSERNREWWNVLVSDALNLMDSTLSARADSDAHIIICGSTNAIDRVDPALLRPGRLEKIIEIKPPDLAGTINILKFHLNGEVGGDLTGVGAMLQGSTAAEIMHAVRTARRAARHAGRDLTVQDLERAALPIETIPQARLFRMAVHESAHAVAAMVLGIGTVRQVVLRERGGTGGQTVVDFFDRDLVTRADIEDRVVASLAAREAERSLTGTLSVGSGGAWDSDIGVSTMQLAQIYASFGMAGDATYLGAGPGLIAQVASNPDLRERVGRHMRALERRAARLVASNRGAVLAVAARLAEKRHLVGAEVDEIVRGRLRMRRRRVSRAADVA